MSQNILYLLEQVRAIAQTGLHYAKDSHDQERYQRLLDLAVQEYAPLGQMDEEDVRNRLKRELGAISPKVAGSAAIFSDEGHILLMKRSDDRKWTIPGGLCEVWESPSETAVREVLEETGLEVRADNLIDIFCIKAGTYNRIHTMYSTMFHCIVVGGRMTTTQEAIDIGFFDHRTILESEWHLNFQMRVERAYQFWCKQQGR